MPSLLTGACATREKGQGGSSPRAWRARPIPLPPFSACHSDYVVIKNQCIRVFVCWILKQLNLLFCFALTLQTFRGNGPSNVRPFAVPFSLLPLCHGFSSKDGVGGGGGGEGRGPGYMGTLDRLHLVLRNTSKYFGLYHVAVVLSFLRSQISLAVI